MAIVSGVSGLFNNDAAVRVTQQRGIKVEESYPVRGDGGAEW